MSGRTDVNSLRPWEGGNALPFFCLAHSRALSAAVRAMVPTRHVRRSSGPGAPSGTHPSRTAPAHHPARVLLAIHAIRSFAFGLYEEEDIRLLDVTAFVPARFSLWIGLADPAAVLET